MTLAGRQPTASLFAQLIAFGAVSLLAAFVINLLVVFNLPPPAQDFYPVDEIALALKGHATSEANQHRPLIARLLATPPAIGLPWSGGAVDEPSSQRFKTELAKQTGIAESNIVIITYLGRYADRRAYALIQNELAKDGHSRGERFLYAPFKIGIRQTDGRWLDIEPKHSLVLTSWQQMAMVWLLLSTLVISPIAYVFARRLARPISQFAAAAERLGRDPDAPPLVISGPSEIAVAVLAFNEMQGRLKRYVEYRTGMAGAIAHDLRTPLTRLRFRLEAAPDHVRVKMAADVAEMEAMISGTLAFVRDAAQPSARTRMELSSLLESLADEMSETGLNVTVQQSDRVVIDGDPIALRRMFNNLLDNAVKFGVKARVRVLAQADEAVVEIDDDGPGLPPIELERVFEPFYRAESSRSKLTGGIGLGLAVVRAVARAHGGDAALINRAGGGITAHVHLPV